VSESNLGRGAEATADMKARIARMRRHGFDLDKIITVLWDRTLKAELGHGYSYEYAPSDEV
jgi:hypothetical protein